MATVLLCVLLSILQWTETFSKPANEMKFQHMKVLDETELDSLRQKNEVSAVYYYKRDVPRLKGFLKELDKTAEYLKLYGVEVGFFDCGNLHEAKEPKCNGHNVEFQIFTYKNNHVLLDLSLDTMFDVDSIMSNMLQLVLIHDVPILQSVKERIEFENKYKGQKDILFTYQKAIGTFDHRIFMEVAFAYQDKFKFAVCTNKQAAQDLKDNTGSVDKSIWVLRCKDWTYKDIKCPHLKYTQKHDLATLASFVKTMTYPKVYKMPSDGREIPYYQDKGIPVVYIIYDKKSAKESLIGAKDISDAFFTILGVVVVDTDKMTTLDMNELGYIGSYPAIAFHTKTMEKPEFKETKTLDLQDIHNFIIEKLNKMLAMSEEESTAATDKGQMGDDNQPNDGIVEMPDEEEYYGEEEVFDDSQIEDVETQDDAVANAVYQSRRKQPDVSLIEALTDKTFPTTIQNKDLVFVLFYLPFDDKSIAFLYAYADASKEIASDPARPLARVNCHDWTDVCSNEHIIIYPTVRMYRNGKMLKDYNGLLDTKAVVTTVKLLNQTNPMNMKDSSSIIDVMKGVLPNGEPVVTETVVMALFDESHNKEMKIFKALSSELEDKMTFTYNRDGDVNKIPDLKYKSPSIVVLRRSDLLKPQVVYNGQMDIDSVKEFVLEASIPSMPELTVEWFPTLYKQGKPIVILFLDGHQESARVKKVMEDIVQAAKFPKLQFVWMNAEPMTVGRSVLSEYDTDSRVPAISYVSLKNGTVFNNKDEYPTQETVTIWLKSIVGEKSSPSKVLEEGDWKPKKKGYDFLALMDKEKERKKRRRQKEKKQTHYEEQGIGFDKDGNEMDLSEKSKAEQESQEDEIREELLALHKTRLYRSKHVTEGHKHHVTEESGGHMTGKDTPPAEDADGLAAKSSSIGEPPEEDDRLRHEEL